MSEEMRLPNAGNFLVTKSAFWQYLSKLRIAGILTGQVDVYCCKGEVNIGLTAKPYHLYHNEYQQFRVREFPAIKLHKLFHILHQVQDQPIIVSFSETDVSISGITI